jgi:hypothetical protein
MQKLIPAGVLLTLMTVVGCGGGKSTVSGTVTFNGKPVEYGTISFQPTAGTGQVFAAEIHDGAYSAENAQPGERKVEIHGLKKFDSPASQEDAMRAADTAKKAGNVGANELVNPTDYIPADAEGNFKVIEIGSGDQTINFDLKSPMPENG